MKTRKTVLLLLIGLMMPALGVHAIDVSIRYHDQSVYFPESDIQVQVTITNNSPDTFRFRLANNRVFNLNFDVRNLTNVALDAASQLITERLSVQPVYYREVTLEPAEQFSFVERLGDYISLTRPGMYIVQAHFHPELIRRAGNTSPTPPLSSNRLSLSIRPSPRTVDEQIAARLDYETGQVLRRTPMTPDQVVAYTISARQRNQWDRFFLYLNIEELLRVDPARERRFLQMSKDDRIRELERFRRRLMEDSQDTQITAVPRSFEILQTTYTASSGRVVVDQRFPADGFTEVRRYTYHLQRRDDIWEIVRYDVNLIGTE
jgi:hypothetical protein